MEVSPALRDQFIEAETGARLIRAPMVARPLAAMIAASILFGAICAGLVVSLAGMTVPLTEVAPMLVIGLAMLGLSAFCHNRYPDDRLAHAAAVVGVAILSLLACAILSNAALRLGMPLADFWLSKADEAAQIDAGSVIRAIAATKLLPDVLAAAYNASGLIVVVLIFAAIARRRTRAAWELVGTIVISMQLVAIASIFAPAWGAMKHFSLEHLQGHGLPVGAGVYQWTAFGHFRDGSDTLVRIADMGGVVAFPSFHTVLALLITQSLHGTRWRWAAVLVSATIILAAMPMGGHYAVDLLAGWLVWAGSAVLVRKLNSPSG